MTPTAHPPTRAELEQARQTFAKLAAQAKETFDDCNSVATGLQGLIERRKLAQLEASQPPETAAEDPPIACHRTDKCRQCGKPPKHVTKGVEGKWAVVCDNGQCTAIGPLRDTANEAESAWNQEQKPAIPQPAAPELKPCPFCGQQPHGITESETAHSCWVTCGCGARGPDDETHSLAKEIWNHRRP